MLERMIGLFTDEELNNIQKANILLVGVGGVGSFCLEVLVRCGIQNITIVDFDTYEESNLNRQLHSSKDTINKKKVLVLKDEMFKINPSLNIEVLDEYLDKNSNLDFNKYDFIIDACDSIKAKVMLITKAYESGTRIVCSLGVGNRLDNRKLLITSLDKTYNDPLGKKLRNSLKKEGFEGKVMVLASSELPIKKTPVSSYIGVSSVAGIMLADYVIKEVIK